MRIIDIIFHDGINDINTMIKERTLVFFVSIFILFDTFPVARADDYFNPEALEVIGGNKNEVDLSAFSIAGGQAPGVYRVDIYVNHDFFETRDVEFINKEGALKPVFDKTTLKSMGIKTEAFPALAKLQPDASISDLAEYVPAATAELKFERQRLDVSVPQAAMESQVRGYVDPALLDQGIPVIFTNYNYTGSHSRNQNGETSQSNFISLRNGANLGAWRLRNYAVWNNSQGNSTGWHSINTYLQRDIQTLKSTVTGGDSNTPSEVFDSIPFRGMQVESSESMVPDSMKGFAPVVRGIAQSNAQVSIRQNGYLIYQSYVAPGPFAINDLYPTSSNGNLEITIKEEDGTERRSVQAFSAAPVMLREGRFKYSLTAGKYRPYSGDVKRPTFLQSAFVYGIPLDTTLYGGVISSGRYHAYALGAGHSFGLLGSLSADMTHAETQLKNERRSRGQSYRVQYAKSISESGTYFTLAGYRYSTGGYYDFVESNDAVSGEMGLWQRNNTKKSKTQINITQTLGDWGSFYVSGYRQSYWGAKSYEQNLELGYMFNHAGVNYGLNAIWSQSPENRHTDRQIAFTVQVPLDKWLSNSWVNYSLTRSSNGQVSNRVGLSGTALEGNSLNYNIQQSRTNQGVGSSGSAGVLYKGSKGNASGTYSYSNYLKQLSYGVEGSISVHPFGVTLGQPVGETFALVNVGDAPGLKIQNQTNVYTDGSGNAVVPYVSSYRSNRIAIDPESLGTDLELETNSTLVYPTSGALVLAKFNSHKGYRAILTLLYEGKPVPFGALVTTLSDVASTGIVSSDGEVYLSGLSEKGELKVKWGERATETCTANYLLSGKTDVGLVQSTLQCRP